MTNPFHPSPLMYNSDLGSMLAAFACRTLKTDEHGLDIYLSGIQKRLCEAVGDSTQSEFTLLCYGLKRCNDLSQRLYGAVFAQLTTDNQDNFMLHLELGELRDFEEAPQFYNRLHRLVLKAALQSLGTSDNSGTTLIAH